MLVFLALPLVAFAILVKVFAGYPQLYKMMPGSVVEGAKGSLIMPGIGVGIVEIVSLPKTGS